MFGKKNEVKYEMKSPFHKIVTGCITLQAIAIMITLILMMAAANFLDTIWIHLICTVLGVFLFGSMQYSACWGIAERERNLVKFGHLKEDKFRGLRAGIYATIPMAVIIIIAIIQSYTNIMPEWVLPTCRFLLCPFVGLVALFVENNLAILLILLCGITPLCTWLGYRNGYKLYRFTDGLVYNTKPRSKDKRVR